jgi:DNA (cytosine-5)-methyltransferase 1
MAAYYNEIDPHAADWLEQLIGAGLIAPGVVDRTIDPGRAASDVRGFTQCHWFAGIGGWSLAFRLAGFPDDRPGWSASLPCQPFSVASVHPDTAAKGQADDRHLLPVSLPLVAECRPPIIFGEQVETQLNGDGSTKHSGRWKILATPAGRPLCQLSLSARDMSESGFRGWPTPAARDGRDISRSNAFLSQRKPAFALYGDPLAGARRALDGDYSGLLPCDGLSVVMERHATKGYGNAIVPQHQARSSAPWRQVESWNSRSERDDVGG